MISILTTVIHAAIEADRVTSLPGYDAPLPFKMYSGYISTPLPAKSGSGMAHTHYVLILSDDAKSPVVVWQQGGPGGSSLIGFLTENGPFTLNDASFATAAYNATGIPTVYDNPHGWQSATLSGTMNSMLFVEHPAPTGFSYCGETGTDCLHDDSTQAELAYSFYVAFFSQAYPELASRAFYMTGESYAGVLVPTLALRLLAARNATNAHLAPWSLTGFALGNDCPGMLPDFDRRRRTSFCLSAR